MERGTLIDYMQVQKMDFEYKTMVCVLTNNNVVSVWIDRLVASVLRDKQEQMSNMFHRCWWCRLFLLICL